MNMDSGHPDTGADLVAAQARLEALDRERAGLARRIAELRAEQSRATGDDAPATPVSLDPSDPTAPVTRASSPEEKIALFAALFRGRTDVYARRWENRRTSQSGFQPACRNEWVAGLCDKRRSKCGTCAHRELLPMTDTVLRAHLLGHEAASLDREFVAGVYPLLPTETCWFLAMDFDGPAWADDVAFVLAACALSQVPAALERSRSGGGAHLWTFFTEPVPAAAARRLGSSLLTRAMESRPEIGLASYDRLFPNQDTMPRGGFGNLIALPLQGRAREQGNSVFLDADFRPWEDQFAYLSSLPRLTPARLESLVQEAEARGEVLGVRAVPDDDLLDEPWRVPQLRSRHRVEVAEPVPDSIEVVLANQVFIPKEGLPPAVRNRLVRIAAFQNPEFYRAQAMHLSTYDRARIIGCAEDFPRHIALPRGCLDEATGLLTDLGARVEVIDKRTSGRPIDVSFLGRLRPEQEMAAQAVLRYGTGVLSAGTAFGKTVVAAHVIARRGVNTLVLVHRQQLLDQWVARLAAFLGLDPKTIGRVGGGRRKVGGVVDVALLQSLGRQGQVDELVAGYGQLIFDECHHVPAGTFELVARSAPARYVLGLSATPARKDGHHPILFMQCGPIRFRVDARRQAEERPFGHRVIVRRTEFRLGSDVRVEPEAAAETAGSVGTPVPGIQAAYAALAADEQRNATIVEDVVEAVSRGRSPVVLTERREHLDVLAAALERRVANVVSLHGGMGAKQRRAVAERIAAIPEGAPRVLVATGRYLGEGFDDARLDTLLLALPISWRGTLAQYAGRLHRLHEGKTEALIYDYADLDVPMLARMHERRLRGYRAMGYEVT